jgi:DNA repair protein RadC
MSPDFLSLLKKPENPNRILNLRVKRMNKSFTVHDLPEDERPRERLQKYGMDALSPAEVIALILGRGTAGQPVMDTANKLLSRFQGFRGISEASLQELMDVDGIGPAKAAQLKAAFEIAKRADRDERFQGLKKTSLSARNPQDAAGMIINELKGKKKEHFVAVLLDTRNRLIKLADISTGSLDTASAHPREVFKEAISAMASAIIIAHNHPSGDCTPSPDDIAITKKLIETGNIIGIEVLDHIIVSDNSFLSLKSKGLI